MEKEEVGGGTGQMVRGRTTSGMGKMRKLSKLWLPRTPGDRICHLERGNGAEEYGDGEITTWDGEMDVGTDVCVCVFKRIHDRLVLEINNFNNIKGAVYQARERSSRLRRL